MVRLMRTELRDRYDNKYELDIEFDEADLAKGLVTTKVKATKYRPDTERIGEVEATLTLDIERQVVRVELPGLDPIEINIGEGPEPFEDNDRDLSDPEEVRDFLARMLDEGGVVDHIAQAADYIPVEPGIGCVLKAGVCTTLSQLVQCHHEHRDEGSVTDRAWKVIKCLGAKSPFVIGKACLRTARCWLTAGIL